MVSDTLTYRHVAIYGYKSTPPAGIHRSGLARPGVSAICDDAPTELYQSAFTKTGLFPRPYGLIDHVGADLSQLNARNNA